MRIAIIAPGEMGSGIAARLRDRGAAVVTSLRGRGPESAKRAARAGMTAIEDDAELVSSCDLVLSILPPVKALELAQRLAPHLAKAGRALVYADCNAIAPQTVREVEALIRPAGVRFLDVGIIGGPPRPDGYGPHLYVSGENAHFLAALRDFGLDIRLVAGGIGAASALKLSYAALTKGLTAIGAAVARCAANAEVGTDLRAELRESQPQLLAWLQRQIPTVEPKAYRWVGEMEEIARFLAEDPTADIYRGAARTYGVIAERRNAGDEVGLTFLADLFGRSGNDDSSRRA
jgi:L-threonate 2-dehydrogenase